MTDSKFSCLLPLFIIKRILTTWYPIYCLIILSFYSFSTTPPGKLFKAILTSNESDIKPDSPGEDESALIESVFLHNDKAVDLVLGEEDPHFMMKSSDSSPESSVVSEAGEPLYDESLLKDLFYTTPVGFKNIYLTKLIILLKS